MIWAAERTTMATTKQCLQSSGPCLPNTGRAGPNAVLEAQVRTRAMHYTISIVTRCSSAHMQQAGTCSIFFSRMGFSASPSVRSSPR